ncbi:hypothetical protein FHG87_013362 [Trinorchestia longiramus]|nr:hypothetical protein FHG87_013362 [Trinorchestia longiramus]
MSIPTKFKTEILQITSKYHQLLLQEMGPAALKEALAAVVITVVAIVVIAVAATATAVATAGAATAVATAGAATAAAVDHADAFKSLKEPADMARIINWLAN